MKSKELARKKGLTHIFDFAMDVIWIQKDSHPKVGNYVLIHCMNHKGDLGVDYFSCENIDQLDNVKSKLINLNFRINWDYFNDAREWLNNDKT